MRLLLDTHAVLWALAGSDRIDPVRDMILSPETQVHVSVASWWEIAIKATLGKLDADVTVLRKASEESGFFELPVLGPHIETLARLPMLHRDPFDRLLLSQAISEPMTFLTSDDRLPQYSSLVRFFA